MLQKIKRATACCVAASLTACGGGGSSLGPEQSSPDSPSVMAPAPSASPGPMESPESMPSPGPTPSPSVTPDPSSPMPAPNTSEVMISGVLSYDFVPHLSNGGLDYEAIREVPIRGALVRLLDEGGRVLDDTISSHEGRYQFRVDQNQDVQIEVLAQLERSSSPTWSIKVTDNTDGNALYAMVGSVASSGTSNSTRDLHADAGWGGSGYSSTRVAAPFAILDSVYQLTQTLVDEGFSQNFPPTELRWSASNRASMGANSDGDIGSSHFNTGEKVMYILGHEDNDTDEYDRSVVQHEFTHYMENAFSRSESIGGSHSPFDAIDPRVAFGEGLANAVTAIVSGTGYYEDSGRQNQAAGFRFSLENNVTTNRGWYSEDSTGNIVYDILDEANESNDALDLSLKDVFDVLSSSSYLSSPAFTTIYLFLDELKASNNAEIDVSIDGLAEAQGIFGTGIYGEGETNSGSSSIALPVYHQANIGSNIELCSRGDDDSYYNALEVRRYLRFTVPTQRFYTIMLSTSEGTGEKNPDAFLYRSGQIRAALNSVSVDKEMRTLSLQPGDYVLEVFDANNLSMDPAPAAACFNVSISEA